MFVHAQVTNLLCVQNNVLEDKRKHRRQNAPFNPGHNTLDKTPKTPFNPSPKDTRSQAIAGSSRTSHNSRDAVPNSRRALHGTEKLYGTAKVTTYTPENTHRVDGRHQLEMMQVSQGRSQGAWGRGSPSKQTSHSPHLGSSPTKPQPRHPLPKTPPRPNLRSNGGPGSAAVDAISLSDDDTSPNHKQPIPHPFDPARRAVQSRTQRGSFGSHKRSSASFEAGRQSALGSASPKQTATSPLKRQQSSPSEEAEPVENPVGPFRQEMAEDGIEVMGHNAIAGPSTRRKSTGAQPKQVSPIRPEVKVGVPPKRRSMLPKVQAIPTVRHAVLFDSRHLLTPSADTETAKQYNWKCNSVVPIERRCRHC